MAEFNDALAEAIASAPAGRLIYYTLELQHASFAEPARVVTDVPFDIEFGIEDGAFLDAGEMVTFQHCNFFASRPSFQPGSMPETTVQIDNVSRLLTPLLAEAVKHRSNLTAIYREYVSDDLSAPAYGPVQFVMREVVVNKDSVSGRAVIDNLANRRFPDIVHTLEAFPGLLPS